MAPAELALVSLATVVAWLPRALRVGLGSFLGWLAGSVLRIRRAPVETAMRRAAIDDVGPNARAMYRALGRALVELLWVAGHRGARQPKVLIDDVDVAILGRAIERGPVVIFASHTGNWELAAAAAAKLLAERGRGLYVVAKPMSARGVDRFLARLRARLGLRVVAPQGAFAAARRALAAGHAVAMPIDQVPDAARHGLLVPFLGQAALVDRAPATLAFRAGATVLVVAGDDAGDAWRVHVLGAIAPPSSEARARVWIDGTTVHATKLLEGFVRAKPEAWLWLHRRWRLVAARQAG